MPTPPPKPVDEGFHTPEESLWWEESWLFEWTSEDREVAGFARHAFLPARDEVWVWICIFLSDRIVFLRDHSVPLGSRWGRYEHRGHGLWWDFRPQERMVAWSVQAEAMGIAVVGPEELWQAEVGLPAPIGLDLSFEAVAPPASLPGGYGQFGRWGGDVLLADGVIALEGFGHRDHRWGVTNWDQPWASLSFHDGGGWAGRTVPGGGYLVENGSIAADEGADVIAGFETLCLVPFRIDELRTVEVTTHLLRGPVTLNVSDHDAVGFLECRKPGNQNTR